MTEPVKEQPLSAMVDDVFKGIKIPHRDTRPALMRQLVWDAFDDKDVESVIKELGMIPASREVGTMESKDSHARLTSIEPIQPMLSMIIDIMAQAQTAAMTISATEEEIPDVVKHQVLHFNHRLIFSTIMSTISTLNTLGHINLKVENAK